MTESHQGKGKQKDQMVRAQHRMGQATEQSAKGGGLEMEQVHQVMGLGRWSQQQKAGGDQRQ
jgi:hypothetical protein